MSWCVRSLRVAGVEGRLSSAVEVHRQFQSGVSNGSPRRHDELLHQMPKCDFKPQQYSGPSYERATEIRRSHLSPALVTYYKRPILVHQGHMQWLWDHTGRRYLDMIGGIVTVSVGHSHPKVVESLEKQSRLLWHTTSIYLHPKIHEYAEKLAQRLPFEDKVIYFVNSGSEANDLALLMARLYTGRFDVISLQNAYHGGSPYLMGLTSLSTWRHNTPTGFGMHQTTNPDVYRGAWGGSNCRDSSIQTTRQCDCADGECDACDRYLDDLNNVIQYSMPKQGLAGFFAESIQGVGGTVQYPKNYLKRAFEMIREKGGVCISDEVQTGFGRTGDHYWGFQAHDVIPDIVTMAKGIGNGFPMAAVVTTADIASSLKHALHFNTFGGNPLACAVGSTVLDVIDEEDCQQRSRVVGGHMLETLARMRDEVEVVGDVRGKGLMIGVELVRSKASRDPLDADTVSKIWETCKDLGVLVGKGGLHGNVFRFKPPMCVTVEDADYAVKVLRQAIVECVRH